MNQTQKLSSARIPSFIQTTIALHDKNWFQTGGAADFYSEPTTAHEFIAAHQFAHDHQLPVFILGSGANILISDEGFKGLVIRPRLTAITCIEENEKTALIRADAGTTIHDVIEWSLAHNLLGLEEFSGIPGTIGGSVYINLHYFEFLLSQFLMSATVLEKSTNTLHTVDNNWFNFGYNTSTLHQGKHLLINATFKLTKGSELHVAHAHGRRTEIIRHRAARYPQKNTCGSFFRNFYDHEVFASQYGKKVIWVAYYLDKVGVKGQLEHGDAQVSYQHANMIVNRGKATTSDIITVARMMQQKVSIE
ncbi:MAG: UDP-N-acetylmuramate dehydrogenase, partial [Candidatus Babeliales bacterium]